MSMTFLCLPLLFHRYKKLDYIKSSRLRKFSPLNFIFALIITKKKANKAINILLYFFKKIFNLSNQIFCYAQKLLTSL